MSKKETTIFRPKLFYAPVLWFGLTLIATCIQLLKPHGINNYSIFKGVFWHSIRQTNLFAEYPAEYGDLNHYGPFFAMIIAPFAIFPDFIGCFLWCMANAVFLFYAVRRLPVSARHQNVILLVAAVELMTAMHNVQFNPMITSWIIFSYVLVHKEKDFWATLFIAAGILTKLYGITGLAFFMFSKHKKTFLLSFIFWMAAFFCLPVILSSAGFVIQSYKDWYHALVEKNSSNIESTMQGMTVMRIFKKVLHINIPDMYVLFTAGLFYVFPLLRFKQLRQITFQLNYLALLLIGVVIFSSSAESSTFIIAMTGIGIWYVLSDEKSVAINLLLAFSILFTSLSTTDLFPHAIKEAYVRPLAFKAMPCFIVWLILAYKLLAKDFSTKEIPS